MPESIEVCVIDDWLQNLSVWVGGLRLSVGGGSVRGIRLREEVCVTDHAQVLRECVDSADPVGALFGRDRSGRVGFGELSVAMRREGVGAVAAYVASIKEQGFAVPGGLEDRNSRQAEIYFPHEMTAVD